MFFLSNPGIGPRHGVQSGRHRKHLDTSRDSMDRSTVQTKLMVTEDGKPPTLFHWQVGNCIGGGQFGSVSRALNLSTGQMVAVKRIRLEGLKEEDVATLMQEVDLLKSLSHPSIIKYEGMARDDDTLSIVLEYAENGSLGQTLKAFGKLNETLVASYVVKILEGLHYLHRNDIVHCDLKAENILITQTGNVKLSYSGVYLNLRAMEREIKDVAVEPNRMAPEVIELKGSSTKSDIWSLGCTVIELLTGHPPYADIANSLSVMFRIVDDDMPPLPEGSSELLKDFLKLCFDQDPIQRPTAEVLCEHPWLKSQGVESNFSIRESGPQDSNRSPELAGALRRRRPRGVFNTNYHAFPASSTTIHDQTRTIKEAEDPDGQVLFHRTEPQTAAGPHSSEQKPDLATGPFSPKGPRTSAQVLEAVSSIYGHCLVALAALIGHASSHSEPDAHTPSLGIMYDLTIEVVEVVDKLCVLAEALIQHPELPQDRVGNVASTKSSLYDSTRTLANSVRRLPFLCPTSMQGKARKRVFRETTSVLEAGVHCYSAVRLCLQQPARDKPLIFNLPSNIDVFNPSPAVRPPNFVSTAAEPTTSGGISNDSPMHIAGDEAEGIFPHQRLSPVLEFQEILPLSDINIPSLNKRDNIDDDNPKIPDTLTYRSKVLSTAESVDPFSIQDLDPIYYPSAAALAHWPSKTSVYSTASSRTMSTDYGLYYTRRALSQDSEWMI